MTAGFWGRDSELAALEGAVATSRLVVVAGPPGVGKSGLVESWAEAQPRGLVFCRIERSHDTEGLDGKVAEALGVPVPQASERARLGELLAAAGAIVLVLDGVDRCLVAVEDAARAWLAAAPQLRIVVTSRTRMASAPATVSLGPLALADAVALFVERARIAGFVPRGAADERSVLEELVTKLDRLPLALVLAASRTTVLSPEQILERLGPSLDLLEGRHGDEALSLRAALQLSWSMLTESERRTLLVASLFEGPFTAIMASGVLDADGRDALAAFESLVHRSLVQRTAEGGRALWFRLLETVRSFAREQLAGVADAIPLRVAVARHVAERGTELAAALETQRELVASEELALMADDLAAIARQDAHTDDRAAAMAGAALAAWGVPRGITSWQLVDASLRAARRTGDDRLIGPCAYWLARAKHRIGLGAEADADLERTEESLGEPKDASLVARVRILRGGIAAERGAFDESNAHLDRALALLAAQHHAFVEGLAQNELGRLDEARGRQADAAEHFLIACSQFRSVGSVRQGAVALQNLAIVRHAEHRLEEAKALLEEALQKHMLAGNPAGVADNLLNTASLLLTLGDLDQAEELATRALDEERRLGNRRFEGLAVSNLALVHHARGTFAAARDHYVRARAVFEETGDRRFGWVLLPFLAAAHAALGQLAEARAELADARVEYTRTDDAGSLVVLDTLEAVALLAVDRAEAEARHARGQARLSADPGASRAPELALALRILEAALRGEVAKVASQPPPAVRVGASARWFQVEGEGRVDLATRASLRNIFAALVEHRRRAPDSGLPQEALFRAGWPGERVLALSARDRVYTAVRTLRRMGLERVLVRRDSGYALASAVQLVDTES